MDILALQAQIEKDLADGYTPFCIVGNAGTVNTGAIDDLTSLSQVAKQYGMGSTSMVPMAASSLRLKN